MGTLPDKSLDSFKEDPIEPFCGSTSEIEPPPPDARAADGLVVVMHKIERLRLLLGGIVETPSFLESTAEASDLTRFSSKDTDSTSKDTGCFVSLRYQPESLKHSIASTLLTM